MFTTKRSFLSIKIKNLHTQRKRLFEGVCKIIYKHILTITILFGSKKGEFNGQIKLVSVLMPAFQLTDLNFTL